MHKFALTLVLALIQRRLLLYLFRAFGSANLVQAIRAWTYRRVLVVNLCDETTQCSGVLLYLFNGALQESAPAAIRNCGPPLDSTMMSSRPPRCSGVFCVLIPRLTEEFRPSRQQRLEITADGSRCVTQPHHAAACSMYMTLRAFVVGPGRDQGLDDRRIVVLDRAFIIAGMRPFIFILVSLDGLSPDMRSGLGPAAGSSLVVPRAAQCSGSVFPREFSSRASRFSGARAAYATPGSHGKREFLGVVNLWPPNAAAQFPASSSPEPLEVQAPADARTSPRVTSVQGRHRSPLSTSAVF